MGCHTWAYIKSAKQFTYQECKNRLLNEYKKDLNERLAWKADLDKGLSLHDLLIKYNVEWCNEEGIKGFVDYIPILDRTIQFIEKELCKEATLTKAASLFNNLLPKDKQGDDPIIGFYYSRGNGFYIYDETIPEIFRVSNYPSIDLTSYEQAINYYYSNPTSYTYARDKNYYELVYAKEDRETDTIVEKELKQFFDSHPEGCLLTFG